MTELMSWPHHECDGASAFQLRSDFRSRGDGWPIIVGDDETLELRVSRPPRTASEALALARDHVSYCPDIGPEPPDTIKRYAEALREKAWWYFWWD